MDRETVEHYDREAEKFAELYRSADSQPLQDILRKWLPGQAGGAGSSSSSSSPVNDRTTKVLEIGCGAGIDALYMAGIPGLEVTAADASEKMLEQASAAAKNLPLHIRNKITFVKESFPLPAKSSLPENRYEAIVASAVIMHIPDPELPVFAQQVRVMLKKEGHFICTFCTDRPPAPGDPRLYINRSPEALMLLFGNAGFTMLSREESKDTLGRDIKWTTLVFLAD